MLDPNGEYVKDLLVLDKSGTETPYGLALLDSEHLLITIEGSDRVVKVNLNSGYSSVQSVIADGNLSGTMRGIARLTGGDLVISELSNVERYSTSGSRITVGAWPKALQTTGTNIAPISSGGFIHCSTGTDVIRAYDDSGTQTATAASGIGGTTDVTGCSVGPGSKVAAAFNGTTDTIRVYSSAALSSTVFSYSNTTLLGNPQAVGFRPNGNVLAVDGTYNYLIEITSDGSYLKTIVSSAIAGPVNMLVLP